MSSILKALKKLESEKAQRDELSTAVASDILRSSRNKRRQSFSLVFTVIFFAIIILVGVGFYLARPSGTPEKPAKVVDQAAGPVIPDSSEPSDSGRVVVPPETTPDPAGHQIKLPVLSGIVYQDEPASRMAIINDLPVMEGTRVEGFEVVRILHDRVLLARDASEYEIALEPN